MTEYTPLSDADLEAIEARLGAHMQMWTRDDAAALIKAVRTLTAAAKRFDDFRQNELEFFSDEGDDYSTIRSEMRHLLDDEIDAFHTALGGEV